MRKKDMNYVENGAKMKVLTPLCLQSERAGITSRPCLQLEFLDYWFRNLNRKSYYLMAL